MFFERSILEGSRKAECVCVSTNFMIGSAWFVHGKPPFVFLSSDEDPEETNQKPSFCLFAGSLSAELVSSSVLGGDGRATRLEGISINRQHPASSIQHWSTHGSFAASSLLLIPSGRRRGTLFPKSPSNLCACDVTYAIDSPSPHLLLKCPMSSIQSPFEFNLNINSLDALRQSHHH